MGKITPRKCALFNQEHTAIEEGIRGRGGYSA